MKDIKTVGDAIDYSERTIEALRLKAEELDPAERAAFEAELERRLALPDDKWLPVGADGLLEGAIARLDARIAESAGQADQ